ncbi:MAG: hypothetical protein IT215_06470 [Chitinophagaceae bacterium]|nr:hypothetical protein [Chitinophagaceae bacterium]
MKSDNKTNIILTLVVLSSIALLALCFIAWGAINNKNSEILVVSEKINTELQKESSSDILKKVAKETEVNREKLNQYFVSKDDIVGFIERVEALAKSASLDVVISSVNLSEIDQNKNQFLNLELKSFGSWQNSMYLLALIENLPYLVKIESSKLQLSNDSKNTGKWELNIKMNVLTK